VYFFAAAAAHFAIEKRFYELHTAAEEEKGVH
jgi:hypothetical protein